ncbi:MAG: hypothetical protein GTO02_13645 [Candidatus Dadabacteria bacterium]|nr:hypothetical protein [Candidatus Dadabacteria bacterium]NIQ15391.1 hypothetical protein [Candidatus Dadabacteria bacterium]
MFYYILKLIISALLIVLISEIAKKSSFIGALIASVPLISIIAIFWIYFDTQDLGLIAKFSKNIFWLVLPSLIFFVIFPVLLKYQINFYISIFSSLSIMIICYFFMLKILSYYKINL